MALLRRLLPAVALVLAGCAGSGDTGASDQALVLDGEAWVDFGDPGNRFDLLPGGERTFALWVRYDRPQYHAKILDKTEPGAGERGFSAFVHQYSTSLGFWHQGTAPLDPTGFAKAGTTGTRRVGDGAWHHVALVQRDTLVEGWVDGRLDFVEHTASTLAGLANDGPLLLGWNGMDVIRFQGTVDELSVWDRALGARELRRLMYDRPAPDAPGLLAWWPMDGSGSVVRDATPGGQDGRGEGLAREAASRPLAPPFTERPAFFALVGLLALAAGWGILRLYGLRLVRQKRKLQRQVEDRVRDLARTNAEKDAALALVASQARRLEELDRTRRRFFANISHEFRTPLSLVVGPLGEVVAEGEGSGLAPELRESMGGALRSARRLRHLTEQLLDLARLESGALRLDPRPLDLVRLLDELARGFRPAARAEEVTLEVELPDEAAYLVGDPQRLETIFSNLLSNALRFTPPGGRVRLSLEVEEARGRVVVEDDGPGIPLHEAERVFERFHQTPDGMAGGGTGIGLALVRELTELHGGTVALDPGTERGARFRLELPLGLPDGVEPPPPDAAAAPRLPASPAVATAPRRPAADGDGPDPDEPSIPLVLVVEDHAELREYLARHLARAFRVEAVADGAEALARAREELPDVVVSDVMMRGMDGLELLEALRADAELEAVPVILLTARDELRDRLEGFRAGADDYLAKPFEPPELLARVRALLDLRLRLRRRLLADGGLAAAGVGADGDGAAVDADSLEARARRAVEAHLADPAYGVSELAADLAMERTGLYRRMTEELDVAPSDFMREARMEAAARLLAREHTVAEVAYAVGYGSVSSFSRRFKERFGTTPGAWAPERTPGGETVRG